MTRITTLLLLAALLTGQMACTPQPETSASAPQNQLSASPDLLSGQLDNGLSYQILHHDKPKAEVVFILTVKVGRDDETLNEQGFAHLLEHLVVNGTALIEGESLETYLNNAGLLSHKNARTSDTDTSYFLKLPTAEPTVLEHGYEVLADWASQINLSNEVFEKERDIVLAEYRKRYETSKGRLQESMSQHLRQGTQYAKRTHQALNEITQTATPAALKAFHQIWYRPDLMAVTVIGDINPETVKNKLQHYLGDLPSNTTPLPLRQAERPSHDGLMSWSDVDNEAARAQLSLYKETPKYDFNTASGYQRFLTDNVMARLVNARLNRLIQQGKIVANAATMRVNRDYGGSSYIGYFVTANTGELLAGYSQLLDELVRLQQHGVSVDELAQAKSQVTRSNDKAADRFLNKSSLEVAKDYAYAFVNGVTIQSAEQTQSLIAELLQQITPEQIKERAEQLISAGHPLIHLRVPAAEQDQLPQEQQLLHIWQQAGSKTLARYDMAEEPESLLEYTPVAGSVVAKQYFKQYDAHLWTLSNGVKVSLKQTPFEHGYLDVYATSHGGYSLFEDSALRNLRMMDQLSSKGGLGALSPSELDQLLSPHDVKLEAKIESKRETLHGHAANVDLPTLMQYLHLSMTQPVGDLTLIEQARQQAVTTLQRQKKSSRELMAEAVLQLQYGDDPRHLSLVADDFIRLDLATASQAYRQRFANAADFHFTFVGDFELETIEPLLSQYLASLPANSSEQEHSKERKEPIHFSQKDLTLYHGEDQNAITTLYFYGESDYSKEKKMELMVLSKMLAQELKQRLREELAATYLARSTSHYSTQPNNLFQLKVEFDSSLARQDELIAQTHSVIARYQQDGPAPQQLASLQKAFARALKKRNTSNAFWCKSLHKLGDKPIDELEWEEQLNSMNALTVASLKHAANIYFNSEGKIIARLLPEFSRPQEPATPSSGEMTTLE